MESTKKRRSSLQLTLEFIISTVVITLATLLPLAAAQNKIVNIMLFYEDPDSVRSFDEAVNYVKNYPALGYSIGETWRIQSNGTDGSKLITSLCKDIDAAYKMPAGKQPDIIVDFTRNGIPSEAVKLLTKTMTLPTISGSFGQEGDIRSWRDVTENQKNYLIQIAPPADMVPQAVRSIASQQDMTSAAFLFDTDDKYAMYHKMTSLLENLPTKQHVIAKLEKSSKLTIRKQIEDIVDKNITNFFIGAKPNEISDVLKMASNPKFMYFDDGLAWYSMSMEPGFPNCYRCKNNMSLIHLEPIFSNESNPRWEYLSFKKQRLMELFYFDLTMNAVASVAKMMKDGTWKSPPLRICKEVESAPDDAYTIPLFDALRDPEISKNNLLGRFYLDAENKVGRSHSDFKMAIYRLGFEVGQAKPVSMRQIGVWRTGFGEIELISVPDKEEAQWKAHVAEDISNK